MITSRAVSALVIGMFTIAAAWGCTAKPDAEGFVPLFNGKDLSNWEDVNGAPSTFTVRDEMIIVSGKPISVLRTDRQYENFIVELEWRHMQPKGNAGFFIWSDPVTAPGQPFTRSVEVQVLDGRNSETHTSHGDIFPIHGAKMTPDRPHPSGPQNSRCLPSEWRCKPSPEWNHYRITANDGVIKLAVNGKEVSGGYNIWPRKGYICIEAEGSEAHFRNLRIKELPSTGATAAESADLDRGFESLYTGVDLSGWHTGESGGDKDSAGIAHWQVDDWQLQYDGEAASGQRTLWSDTKLRDFEMIIDVKGKDTAGAGLHLRGSKEPVMMLPPARGDAARNYDRVVVTVKGGSVSATINGEPITSGIQADRLPKQAGPIGIRGGEKPLTFANIYVRPLNGR